MFKKLNRKYFVSLGLHSCSDENDKEQIFHSEDNRLLINNVDSHLKAPYKWIVEIQDSKFNTIGLLTCAYVAEFEAFLKLCRYELISV